ncbi:MAG: exodeoxyribonuclease III [Alphaproteobacteria bacterium]|nr:exodeoxyribonuclease III [Alphaproteobacteria bacterium]
MKTLRLATWNINSVRLRMPIVERLIAEQKPDILCLQETKVENASFPKKPLEALGYVHHAIHGQRGYHGVAILSRVPLEKITSRDFCEKGDARHVCAMIPGGIELHNLYVPAGGDIPDPTVNPKFAHKLAFVEELEAAFVKRRGKKTARAIAVGDLNIAPGENDVWSHKQLLDVVSHTPAETSRFEAARAAFDWIDVTREIVPADEKIFSWWSYRNQDWRKSDRGRRLDHVWIGQGLKGAVRSHAILKDVRDWEKPSDHVPIVVDLAIG